MTRKIHSLTAISLGMGWLISIGAAFVLGVLSAFAFHLAPDAVRPSEAMASLAERDLMVTIERFSGEPADLGSLKSVAAGDQLPGQLESALRAILRHPESRERLMAAHRITAGLPFRKRMACIRFLGQLPASPSRNQVWGIFLEDWGSRDGRSAMGFATTLSTAREQQLAISAVLRGWGRHQPAEAWGWVLEHSGNTRRAEQWLETILANLGQENRMMAFDLVRNLPDSAFRSDMALAVMDQILENEPPAEAVDWLGELPQESVPEAASLVALRWSLSDPRAAAEFLHNSFPEARPALQEILGEWAFRAPESALDWTWESLSSNQRRQILPDLAAQWIARNGPAPLASWINRTGPHQDLDNPIRELALATTSVDPPTALSWAHSLLDPELRSLTEIQIARQWLEQDPETAANSLPDLLRTAEARATLLGDPAAADQAPSGKSP